MSSGELKFASAVADPAARRELWAWSALAILSLGVAGVFALLLALSRTPGIQDAVPWPLDFFRKGLVIHVVFAFIIWFLAMFGAIMHLATWSGKPRLARLGTVGVGLAFVACLLILLPALMDRGEPTLNNYVPAIVDPVYYAGIALLAGAMTLPAAQLFLASIKDESALADVAVAAATIYGVALVCFGLAFHELSGETPSHGFNEALFWGGGHMIQFLTTTLMLGAWAVLAEIALGADALPRRIVRSAVLVLALFTLVGPVLYLVFPGAYSAARMDSFSRLLWALGPSTVVVAWAILRAVRRIEARPWSDPAFLCLLMSIGVFGLGGVLGMFIDGADTRTPAHYHGVIAGVTLAFMGLFHRVLIPLLDRPSVSDRVVRVQLILFAAGQTLACLGLFLAGGYGAPRKVAGAAQGLEAVGAIAGMVMNGIGAVIAVAGGVMFIWTAGRAVFSRRRP